MPYPLCFRERRVHELARSDTRIASRLHSLPASLLRQLLGRRMLDLQTPARRPVSTTGHQAGDYRVPGRRFTGSWAGSYRSPGRRFTGCRAGFSVVFLNEFNHLPGGK